MRLAHTGQQLFIMDHNNFIINHNKDMSLFLCHFVYGIQCTIILLLSKSQNTGNEFPDSLGYEDFISAFYLATMK